MSHVHDSAGSPAAAQARASAEPIEPREASLGALVTDLSTQIPELVRSELRLAQAEVAEKGKRAGAGVGMFSVAGLSAFFGLGVLVATLVLVLDLMVPAWAAALIVAAALLAVAGVAALAGKNKVAEVGSPAPMRAVAGIKQDLATLKGARS